MRIFTTRAFGRFARKERIEDAQLCDAIARADRGLIAYRSKTRSVFLFGFAKNDQDNIDDDELKNLRKAAAEMLSWTDDDVAVLVAAEKWKEVECDE